MKIDITSEIYFKTARSGGKGGQNVNKVETMVEGRFNVNESHLITDHQKRILQEKLYNKISSDGCLLVKSQQARTQLANKELVVFKMLELIKTALIKKKTRIATKASKGAIEQRIESKKRISFNKINRQKINVREL